MRSAVLAAAAALFASSAALAQSYLMMPDSTSNALVLFNTETGAVENPSYFSLALNTPIHAMQVGSEIWVSEQNGNRISRWSLTGEFLGAVFGSLTNIRGMELANNRVYVSRNDNAVEVFDTSGSFLFSFATAGQANSPFSVLDHQGGLLVGASTATFDEVHKYDYEGASQGSFINNTTLNFVEQLSHTLTGDVIAASFTGSKVAILDKDSGAILNSFTASNARGAYQLTNGSIIWSNGSGVRVWDPATNISTQVYSGGGRYFDILNLSTTPTCGTADFDGDGDSATDADIEAFFACLAGNCCPTCWHLGADFDADGDSATDADIEAFFRVLAGNPC